MHRRWIPLIVAGATVMVIGLAVAMVAGRTEVRDNDGPTAEVPAVTSAPARNPSPEDLVIRDGMTVEASGTVLARYGEPERLCAPVPELAILRPEDAEGPRCSRPITVVGVDLERLTDPGSSTVARFGRARLRGTWQAGTITVTDQGPPVARPLPELPTETPCPPPPGGWREGTGYTDSNAIHDYLYQEHPDQFATPYMTYPNGVPAGPSPPGDAATVMVIEVVRGDVEAARAELQRRYEGNLCVVARPDRLSIADEQRTQEELRPVIESLMRDQSTGVFSIGFTDVFVVELMMVTPELYERFRTLGFDRFQLQPWLRPVTP
jgi:hypothetical protein